MYVNSYVYICMYMNMYIYVWICIYPHMEAMLCAGVCVGVLHLRE